MANKPRDPRFDPDYQGYKDKILKDVFKCLDKGKPKDTPEERLYQKVQKITVDIRNHIRPILKAGGAMDRGALNSLVHTLYIQAFQSLSKDELAIVCTWLHSEIMMETVDIDPHGTGTPDKLSGV